MTIRLTAVAWRIAVLLLSLAALLGVSEQSAAADGSAVVVSLTFDDGLASQLTAHGILQRHGVRATFYVNSAHVGDPDRLTAAQIRGLARAGHEIGGHTEDHVNLPTVDPSEQRRQICDDRIAISRMLGADQAVTSFAYPYGAARRAVEKAVEECGYLSARIVGGLNPDSGECSGCPHAESVPPPRPFAVRSSISFVTSTPIAQAKEQILAAQRNGGGWVPLVFHDVCSDCSDLAIRPRDLDELVGWIIDRGIAVKTVGTVVGGTARPLVRGPKPTVREGHLVNASLEIPGSPDGMYSGLEASYCWRRTSFGDNTATWSRVRDSHSGRWAERVQVSALRSGGQKLISRTDTGSCSPAVTAGSRYELGAWYRSDAAPRIVTYVRGADGHWRFWTASPLAESSTTWRQLRFTTPPIPQGATRISFGVEATHTGSVTIDDLSLATAGATAAGSAAAWTLRAILLLMLLPVAGFVLVRARARRNGTRPHLVA